MVSLKDKLEIAGSSPLPLLSLKFQKESRELSGTIAMTRMEHSDSISGSRTNGMESTLMTVFQLIQVTDHFQLEDQETRLGGCH